MTPKQKAQELFDKFNEYSKNNTPDYNQYWDKQVAIDISKYSAKQCALIAVDEMLDFRNNLYVNENSLAHQYLLKVKTEINKL